MTRILVVEDDPLNRDLLSRWLVIQGFEVLLATDGVQGVSMARDLQPDLILMDIGLPVLNGWQATHRIKQSTVTGHIPVIALSAYVLTEDRTASFAAGCDEYETKPIHFPRLLLKMQSLLAKGQT
jgi:CheY-like chemotaxis protein